MTKLDLDKLQELCKKHAPAPAWFYTNGVEYLNSDTVDFIYGAKKALEELKK